MKRYSVSVSAGLTPEDAERIKAQVPDGYTATFSDGSLTVDGGYKTWEELWVVARLFETEGRLPRSFAISAMGYNVPEPKTPQ